MRRRIGRPGLVGLAARTAVVAGTANAVNGHMNNKQQQRSQDEWEQQQYQAAQQQAALNAAAQDAVAQQLAAAPAPAAVAAAAPAPAADDIVASLQKLSALRDAGALSDDEFNAAKARLLA